MHREHALKVLSGARDLNPLETERRRWIAKTAEHTRRMAPLLDAYRKWADSAADRLMAAAIRRQSDPSYRARQRRSERQQQYLIYWARQQRAVQAVMELELSLAALAADMTREGAATIESVQLERDELLRELAGVIEWLETRSGGSGTGAFPPPQVRLISAEECARDWERRVLERSRSRLPAAVEVTEPRGALPGRNRPWCRLEPAKVFAMVLEGAGALRLVTGFRDVVASQQLVMREIERAREVVAFGEETARAEGPAGQAVAQEAVQNALSLLLHQSRTTPEVRPATEASLIEAEARALLECHTVLEKGRVGLLTYLTHQRGRQAVARLRELFLAGLQAASRRAWLVIRRFFDQILIKVGWMAPPWPQPEPVTRRVLLGQVLELQLHARELPMIYRRLFRVKPIEEPRFLVGRETEMAGLSEALAQWNSGARTSVIVVGARGSGKTSLLNCAVSGLFTGTTVVRGQPSVRVTTGDQMLDLLRSLFELPKGSGVARALSETRRIVIIEELERSFLRVINGFEALRELLTLIYRTSASTLWILSTNETAFRYLDAVADLGRHFSHRINAMSVGREDLVGAILQRHDLSGLRLEFARLREEDPRVSHARRLFGFEQDAEQLFFEALYRHSEGIFRSAFELWQGSIERVEGGIIHMQQPLIPDYRPLLSELGHEDHFILQAMLQHGGLTVEEVAQVTRLGVEDSGRRLERLRLLEILEPEPDYAGLRVRPEAGQFVREALHRQNLW